MSRLTCCYLLLTLLHTDSLGIKHKRLFVFLSKNENLVARGIFFLDQNMPYECPTKRVENTNGCTLLPFSRRAYQIRRRCGATKNPPNPTAPTAPLSPLIRSFVHPIHVLALAKLSLSDHTSAPLELDPIADPSAYPSFSSFPSSSSSLSSPSPLSPSPRSVGVPIGLGRFETAYAPSL